MRHENRIRMDGYGFVTLFAGAASAQSAPQLINYQGRIANESGVPLTGSTVDLTFRFYSAATGGTLYLTVIQQDVAVNNGLYNVLVGSGAITPGAEISLADVSPTTPRCRLGVAVDADPEMTPRSRIASVPYALACSSSAGIDLSLIDRGINQPDYDSDGHDKPLFLGDDCNDSEAEAYPARPKFATASTTSVRAIRVTAWWMRAAEAARTWTVTAGAGVAPRGRTVTIWTRITGIPAPPVPTWMETVPSPGATPM